MPGNQKRFSICHLRLPIENRVLSKFDCRASVSGAADVPRDSGSRLRRCDSSETASAVPHSGDNSAVAPPVPIPNTEVKRCSPDGSTAIGRARVGRRQNQNPGEFISSGFLLLAAPIRARPKAEENRAVGTSEIHGKPPRVIERERTSQ
jgi:hypothetical protein